MNRNTDVVFLTQPLDSRSISPPKHSHRLESSKEEYKQQVICFPKKNQILVFLDQGEQKEELFNMD